MGKGETPKIESVVSMDDKTLLVKPEFVFSDGLPIVIYVPFDVQSVRAALLLLSKLRCRRKISPAWSKIILT